MLVGAPYQVIRPSTSVRERHSRGIGPDHFSTLTATLGSGRPRESVTFSLNPGLGVNSQRIASDVLATSKVLICGANPFAWISAAFSPGRQFFRVNLPSTGVQMG